MLRMESLAAFVANLFLGLIFIAIANAVIAIFVRRGKLRMWLGVVVNTLTGIAAFWAVSVAFALGVVPLVSFAVGSVILILPRRRS